jgi:pyridoxal phosphate enzyme (YggS family)
MEPDMSKVSIPKTSSEDTAEVSENLEEINTKIFDAARRAGRSASDVSLVAVSKVQPFGRVEAACLAGHRVFGENRVQEAIERWPSLRARFPDLKLHLIGPLQTNKVADAVAFFDVIESVDRPKLAAALRREMDKQGVSRPCFIQVNTGEEPRKAGVAPLEADSFITSCRDEHGLDIVGLMCIPPQSEEPALHFALLREIALRNDVASLSMGMSGDFETAIELGATHIRVGTAIFGAREQR